MKFADWVPIVVAVVALIGALVAPGLTGNRPRQQLEALKAVREGIESTDDEEVRRLLEESERGIATRIYARYGPNAVRFRRTLIALFVPAGITLGVLIAYVVMRNITGATSAWSSALILTAQATLSITLVIGAIILGPAAFGVLMRVRTGASPFDSKGVPALDRRPRPKGGCASDD